MASALSMAAQEPGVVIMYADGTQHSKPFTSITRLEIGSDAVVMVHSDGSENHKFTDIDRILIGAETSGIGELPADAVFAIWPTVVDESFSVITATDCNVLVHDLNGHLVAGPVGTTKGETTAINTSGLASGYYLVSAGEHTVKIIKK